MTRQEYLTFIIIHIASIVHITVIIDKIKHHRKMKKRYPHGDWRTQ